jgi:hypothetical protein
MKVVYKVIGTEECLEYIKKFVDELNAVLSRGKGKSLKLFNKEIEIMPFLPKIEYNGYNIIFDYPMSDKLKFLVKGKLKEMCKVIEEYMSKYGLKCKVLMYEE